MIKDESISVIICTWNRAQSLSRTLESLAAQSENLASQLEVIVVDNNSTDDTRSTVEQMAKQWTPGSIRYEFEGRQGKQFALNRGVAVARHRLLAFTDDDILFSADWLRRIVELFADPQIELAGGKTLLNWPPSGRPAWFADTMVATLAGVDEGNSRVDPAPPDYAPAGSNLIARSDLFNRVGGFSETHFRHMDFEFGMRCNRAGVRVVYEPSIVVYAPVDERCLSPRYFKRWAFKAGIARSDGIEGIGRRLPAVPPWIYRQIAEDALYVAWNVRRRFESTCFSRELRLWRGMGTVANAWRAWMLPSTHGRWVEKYSQKVNDLY
jgi:glycosyltransferase involved in cell wall biosynthesis